MDGYPCTNIDTDYVKPGKGQAFTRVKSRNLKTGRVVELTMKSTDNLEAADVELSVLAGSVVARDEHLRLGTPSDQDGSFQRQRHRRRAALDVDVDDQVHRSCRSNVEPGRRVVEA